MAIGRLVLAGCILIWLSACTFGVPLDSRSARGVEVGSIPKTSKSKSGNPSSYVVMGKRYYVLDNAAGFVQRGMASWYGTKFHGRKTASGEIYNMHALTAAHKTLPIPVYVRVKNLENGRSVNVRVNDRGPFVGGRIIDLSFAAAKKLGIIVAGTAKVEISALRAGQNPAREVIRTIPLTDKTEQDVPLFIQMGSFGSKINAINLLRDLRDANELAAAISELRTDRGSFFRVRVGPLYDIDEANAVIRRLKNKGFVSVRIVVQE
ncbi:MAG: septal ring lytic transglycosylase RlpA family protein [Proteobacteria bacterium]|nr:septal ring lytic transglycosylase RlpA family protein [Pseudomonadota bacterium]